MERYFFDLVKPDCAELDFVGRVFSTVEEAYEAAELMAFDLVVKHESEMIGSAIKVSSAEGQKLFSIPIETSCLAATPCLM